MSLIVDTLLTHLPGKRKQTPSGWISFNAPCCDDKRQRGGFIINGGDAVSYHCFNCGFKASWQPGRAISQKMSKLMRHLNISDDIINQVRLEALRLNESTTTEIRSVVPTFDERALPPDSELITDWAVNPLVSFDKLAPVLTYLSDRNLYLEDYPFYWTPKIGFSNRVIIPFYFEGKMVGYTARTIGDAKPKYISEQQPGYVFNLDRQHNNRDFVLVMEGPIDAISIDGTAIMGAEIKDSQNWLLKQLGKEIVFVPDRDHEGPRSVEQAVEYGWSVSMPDWPEGIKDVNDAVRKIGRLATLYLITRSKESNALKIRLRAKKWFPKEYDEKTN